MEAELAVYWEIRQRKESRLNPRRSACTLEPKEGILEEEQSGLGAGEALTATPGGTWSRPGSTEVGGTEVQSSDQAETCESATHLSFLEQGGWKIHPGEVWRREGAQEQIPGTPPCGTGQDSSPEGPGRLCPEGVMNHTGVQREGQERRAGSTQHWGPWPEVLVKSRVDLPHTKRQVKPGRNVAFTFEIKPFKLITECKLIFSFIGDRFTSSNRTGKAIISVLTTQNHLAESCLYSLKF